MTSTVRNRLVAAFVGVAAAIHLCSGATCPTDPEVAGINTLVEKNRDTDGSNDAFVAQPYDGGSVWALAQMRVHCDGTLTDWTFQPMCESSAGVHTLKQVTFVVLRAKGGTAGAAGDYEVVGSTSVSNTAKSPTAENGGWVVLTAGSITVKTDDLLAAYGTPNNCVGTTGGVFTYDISRTAPNYATQKVVLKGPKPAATDPAVGTVITLSAHSEVSRSSLAIGAYVTSGESASAVCKTPRKQPTYIWYEQKPVEQKICDESKGFAVSWSYFPDLKACKPFWDDFCPPIPDNYFPNYRDCIQVCEPGTDTSGWPQNPDHI